MKKSDFLTNADVNDFVGWLVTALPMFPVCLQIGSSRFVPGGIRARVNGIEAVLSNYRWKPSGLTVGDWVQTTAHLASLASPLQAAVAAGNQPNTLAACDAILQWGGNRNKKTGAYPFLNQMAGASAPNLCQYLCATGAAFHLATADATCIAPPVTMMNSMLTKVHALYATDGLPIYDSRVAAAIASLVELWRFSISTTAHPLPVALSFPATLPTRTVLRLFPNATHHPGVMVYGSPCTPADWSGAKIRLGWLMEEVLNRNTLLFASEGSLKDRIHAFEASLFMIGYDVACLACPNDTAISASYKRRVKMLQSASLSQHNKTVRPLSGKGQNITYSGEAAIGFSVIWGITKFQLSPEDINEIVSEFGGLNNVPLGACQTDPTPNSLGQWLVDNGWASARYASAIAAILHEEDMIARHDEKKPILLSFA